MAFDVENIADIDWPSREHDLMNELILADSDKDVIKALTRKYYKGQKKWAADFIEGKGEGQIFLLHGPPGTGKTFTVGKSSFHDDKNAMLTKDTECVAKYTRRPLLRLTVADIGTNERDMEDVLGEWFRRGTDWGAIILIDEADVFLEKRQVKDLQRNSLVSGIPSFRILENSLTIPVFLSCMEYYSGMLFLASTIMVWDNDRKLTYP